MFVKVDITMQLVQVLITALQMLGEAYAPVNEDTTVELEFTDHSIDEMLCINVLRRRRSEAVKMARVLLKPRRQIELAFYEFSRNSREKLLVVDLFPDPDTLYQAPQAFAAELADYLLKWMLLDHNLEAPDNTRTFSYHGCEFNPPQD